MENNLLNFISLSLLFSKDKMQQAILLFVIENEERSNLFDKINM